MYFQNRWQNVLFALCILWFRSTFGIIPAFSAETKILNACTESESFIIEDDLQNLTKDELSRFKVPLTDRNASDDLIWASTVLKGKPNRSLRSIATFLKARSLDRLGWVHLALPIWDQTLAESGSKQMTLSVVEASVDCLSYRLSKFTSIGLSDKSFLRVLQINENPKIMSLLARELKARISKSAKDDQAVLNVIKKDPFRKWVQFLIASRTADTKSMVFYGKTLAEDDRLFDKIGTFGSKSFRLVNRDDFFMLFAQALYSQGKFKEANDSFLKVRNTSNLFPEAVKGRAWSELSMDDRISAVNSSQNLLVGELKSVFIPESFEILAISLNELCRYSEATEAVKLFKKKYENVKNWIVYLRKRFSIDGKSPYTFVTEVLQHKKQVPPIVFRELAKSPLFLNSQSELNLILDERASTKEITKSINNLLNRPASKSRPDAAVLSGLLNELNLATIKTKEREAELISQINNEMKFRIEEMQVSLKSAADAIELVEAEVHSSFARKVISIREGKDHADRVPAKIKDESPDEAEQWDWGYTNVSPNDPTAEVWEDEVGFLWSDISDNCKNEANP